MARFGLLYEQGGEWNGRQIVPIDWIEQSTRTYSSLSVDLNVGYGSMWYTLIEDDGYGHAFFHTGAGVHMLAVFPEFDLVWVHRVDTERDYDVTSETVIRLWSMILEARLDPELPTEEHR
jgi:CubicO group peptidase (beta-lactamase class C family)